MRYRIKINNYQNGAKVYSAYVKYFFGWKGLFRDGQESMGYNYECICESKEDAINRIDLHYKGNRKIVKVDFEYINK